MSANGVFNPSRRRTFLSTNDLSAKQFYLVGMDSAADNSIVLANAQTIQPIGVLLNAPVAGDTAEVALLAPTTFIIAGGTITKNDKVTADSNGKAITTTTAADLVIGVALEAGVAGDRIEVMLVSYFYHA